LRILIVKLSSIGDVVHAMPVACALRDHLPGATLVWLVESEAAPLLRGHEALDDVVVVPRGWQHFWSPAARELGPKLRRYRFDVALDVQGLRKSAVAALLSCARRRIGFAGTVRHEWARKLRGESCQHGVGHQLSGWLNTERVQTHAEHVVDRNLELLRPLGIIAPRVRFAVPRVPQAQQKVQEFLDGCGFSTGFAVIHPGAGRPSKLWPPDRFAAVVRHLAKAHGLSTVVIWGGDAERRWAEEIVAGSDKAARTAPRMGLADVVALTRKARIFISSDSGPLHIAAAVGRPCVGLFATVPVQRNGPFGPGHIGIQAPAACAREIGSMPANLAMQAITVDSVVEACDEVLRRPQDAVEHMPSA
jgi:lipopolysaccharide heptosyltransferase I